RLPDLHLPPLTSLVPPLPGFTTGYPVQLQVLAQAYVTSTDPFYAIHKIGVQVFLLERLSLDNEILAKAAEHLKRKSPGNAFFVYLADGAGQAVADALQHCPASGAPQPVTRVEWIWEQADTEQHWKKSS